MLHHQRTAAAIEFETVDSSNRRRFKDHEEGEEAVTTDKKKTTTKDVIERIIVAGAGTTSGLFMGRQFHGSFRIRVLDDNVN